MTTARVSTRMHTSLGVGPLSAAFSFLHPVESARVEMTAKAVRESVDPAWRSIFKCVVCRPGQQRWMYYFEPRNRGVHVQQCGMSEGGDVGRGMAPIRE